jgi:hypothetical protein
MKNKTAVQWFSNKSYKLFESFIDGEIDRVELNKLMTDATIEAKEMESKQLDDAFKLGLEYANEMEGNNRLDKIEVYDILKNLLSIDDNMLANNPKLLSFIENNYMQLNKTEQMTMDILRNLKKEDIISPEMLELLKIVKSKLYDK